MHNSDFGTFFARYLDIGYTCHILTEIKNICLVIYLIDRLSRNSQHITDRTDLLCHDILRRNASKSDASPLGIIEVRSIPAFLFEPGIIMFTGINTVEYQRPRRCFPTKVRRDGLYTAVTVSDTKIQAESRPVPPGSTVKIPHCFRLMVIPSVSKQDSYGIVAIPELSGNIISDIQVTSVETGIQRIQTVVTDLFTIDI